MSFNPAATRERHLRLAEHHAQEADLLELEASACIHADDPDIRQRGEVSAWIAKQHRRKAAEALIIATNHTDYREESDKDDEFISRLFTQAADCEASPGKVFSHIPIPEGGNRKPRHMAA